MSREEIDKYTQDMTPETDEERIENFKEKVALDRQQQSKEEFVGSEE